MKALVVIECLNLTISRIASMPLSTSRRSSIYEIIARDLADLFMKKEIKIENRNLQGVPLEILQT